MVVMWVGGILKKLIFRDGHQKKRTIHQQS